MSRCVLTVSGLLWIGAGLTVAWAGLFGVAALINRWTRGKGPIYGSTL